MIDKKKFHSPEARKAAIEAIDRYSFGKIDTDELARLCGRFQLPFFEQLPSGNYRCFMVLTQDGFDRDNALIEKYQNIPESEIPEQSTIFV